MRKLATIYPKLLPGEVGCYLSHYRLLQKIVAEKIETALILEDDVCLHADFFNICMQLEKIEYYWDVIRFCGLYKRKYETIAPIFGAYHLVKLHNTACGTQAYSVTWQGAEKLLTLLEVMVHPVDITLDQYWKQGIAFYAIQPYPVDPDDVQSMIDTHLQRRNLRKNRSLDWHRIQRLLLKHKNSFQKRWHIKRARIQKISS